MGIEFESQKLYTNFRGNMKRKYLLLTAALLMVLSVPVYAQGNHPPIPDPPTDGTYIHDELNWLTNDQETEINSIIQLLDNDGLAEIGVVTLNDCGTDKLAFRKSLFDTWGIGHADNNDGLLILVCWYGGDKSRRSVEQLYGPGLNGILSSDKTDQIVQDYFIPAFQQEHPGEGVLAMVSAYEKMFRGDNALLQR
jgi:uncharacterized protein